MSLLHEDIRDSLVQAGQQACGYMNCKLFVQTVTGIPKLEDLPTRSFVSEADLVPGDVLKWGIGTHWAIYIGDGDIMEVEEWGAESRIVPLAEVLEEMDPPDMVFSTATPQREVLLRKYIRGLLKEERGLLGTCVNSFDGDGYCIQPGIPYATTSDFAVGDENADEIPEEEFRMQVTIPSELEQKVAGHEVYYLLDRDNDHYMLYDSDDDVHYFFGGNR